MAFDLSAAAADARAGTEAPEPYQFTFGGQTFTMPVQKDLLMARELREGDLAAALRRALGEEQWRRLSDVEELFGATEMGLLINDWFESMLGLSPGKSSDSSTSSENTES